jgi:hypothetical protein
MDEEKRTNGIDEQPAIDERTQEGVDDHERLIQEGVARRKEKEKELADCEAEVRKGLSQITTGLRTVSKAFYRVQQLLKDGYAVSGYYKLEGWASDKFGMSRNYAFMYARIGGDEFLNDETLTDWNKLPHAAAAVYELTKFSKDKTHPEKAKSLFLAIIKKVTQHSTIEDVMSAEAQVTKATTGTVVAPKKKKAVAKKKKRIVTPPPQEFLSAYDAWDVKHHDILEALAQQHLHKSFDDLGEGRKQDIRELAEKFKDPEGNPSTDPLPTEDYKPVNGHDGSPPIEGPEQVDNEPEPTEDEPDNEADEPEPTEVVDTISCGDYDLSDYKEIGRLKNELDEAKSNGWDSVEVIYKRKPLAATAEQPAEPAEDSEPKKLPTYRITAVVNAFRKPSVEKKLRDTFGPDAQIFSVERVSTPEGRAQRLREVEEMIKDATAEVEQLENEMQEWLDALPENLQSGQKADDIQTAIDGLQQLTQDLEATDFDIQFPGMMG